jgi:hypothetical protein
MKVSFTDGPGISIHTESRPPFHSISVSLASPKELQRTILGILAQAASPCVCGGGIELA